MSLTTGRGPHSANPAGRFDPPVPTPTLYVEPFLRHVRGIDDEGRTVVDSEAVLLVHRPGMAPTYAFPAGDVVGAVPVEHEPAAEGHVTVPWDGVAAWYEEEEQVSGHPRNPYHRIDCMRSSRRLRVTVGDAVLVDTTDVVALFETSLAPKLYVRRDLVRTDLLVESTKTTYCPYKGTTRYWSAVVGDTREDDLVWSYEDPLPESLPIAGLLAFETGRAGVLEDVLTPD